MVEEMKSIHGNKTWELVTPSIDQRVSECKLVFKVKEGKSSIETVKYKARLVTKVFTQVEWVDYNEIFSPLVKYATIRTVLSLVTQFKWELE